MHACQNADELTNGRRHEQELPIAGIASEFIITPFDLKYRTKIRRPVWIEIAWIGFREQVIGRAKELVLERFVL